MKLDLSFESVSSGKVSAFLSPSLRILICSIIPIRPFRASPKSNTQSLMSVLLLTENNIQADSLELLKLIKSVFIFSPRKLPLYLLNKVSGVRDFPGSLLKYRCGERS